MRANDRDRRETFLAPATVEAQLAWTLGGKSPGGQAVPKRRGHLTRCTTPLTFDGYAGKVDIQCEFCTPDRRARDEDNLVATMKAGFDGIADRLGINDRKFHHLEHQYRFSGRQRYGYVLVHVFIKEA